MGVEVFVVMGFQFMGIGARIEPDKLRKALAELPNNG